VAIIVHHLHPNHEGLEFGVVLVLLKDVMEVLSVNRIEVIFLGQSAPERVSMIINRQNVDRDESEEPRQ